ncbi:MAG: DUF7575 domain-containing protein [Promethearchaeota archaeon]
MDFDEFFWNYAAHRMAYENVFNHIMKKDKCPHCSKILDKEDYKFCPYCGKKLK